MRRSFPEPAVTVRQRTGRAVIALCAAALMAVSGLPALAQPTAPGKRVRDQRPRVPPAFSIDRICRVHDDGLARCVRRSQLEQEMPPDLAKRLQQLLRDIYDQFGLDTKKHGLASCGTDEWSAFSAKTNSSGAGVTRSRTGVAGLTPTLADAAAALSACHTAALAEAGISMPSPDADYDQWVNSVVSRVDGQMASCHDSTTSPIASAGTPSFAPSELMETRFGATRAGELTELEGRLSERERDTVWLMIAAVKSAEKKIDKEKKAADAIQDPVERRKAQEKVTQEEEWLLDLVNGFINFIFHFDSEPAEPPAATPDKTPVVTQPCPPDQPCGTSCQEKQAAWQRMKDMCATSHWKAYNCVAFLRKANGCVDAARINPGPDGDLTCPERKSKQQMRKEAYEQQCKRRGWIMLPVPDTQPTCVMPDLSRSMPAHLDICHDPRAMPGPDQCAGPDVPAPGDRPGPPPPDPR
jgi:hypothetical protein